MVDTRGGHTWGALGEMGQASSSLSTRCGSPEGTDFITTLCFAVRLNIMKLQNIYMNNEQETSVPESQLKMSVECIAWGLRFCFTLMTLPKPLSAIQ
jgi:hypothetical protein